MIPISDCAQPGLSSHLRERRQLRVQPGFTPAFTPTIHHATETPNAPSSVRPGARNTGQGTTATTNHFVPTTDLFSTVLASCDSKRSFRTDRPVGMASFFTQPRRRHQRGHRPNPCANPRRERHHIELDAPAAIAPPIPFARRGNMHSSLRDPLSNGNATVRVFGTDLLVEEEVEAPARRPRAAAVRAEAVRTR